jgi:DNA polymerase V
VLLRFLLFSKRYKDADRYFKSTHIELPTATAYTPDLIIAAHDCLKRIYQPGYEYKKTGVILSDLVGHAHVQMHAYSPVVNTMQKNNLMDCIDTINNKFGKHKIIFAAAGLKQSWRMNQQKKSPCFTTSWHELLTITLK